MARDVASRALTEARMPHLPQRSSRGLLISLGLLALVFVLTMTQYRPPAPKPVDAPVGEFSAGRAREILRQLVGDGVPHPVGSAADGIVREKIVQILSDLGYQPQIQRDLLAMSGEFAAR